MTAPAEAPRFRYRQLVQASVLLSIFASALQIAQLAVLLPYGRSLARGTESFPSALIRLGAWWMSGLKWLLQVAGWGFIAAIILGCLWEAWMNVRERRVLRKIREERLAREGLTGEPPPE
jgi:hypothetical protein